MEEENLTTKVKNSIYLQMIDILLERMMKAANLSEITYCNEEIRKLINYFKIEENKKDLNINI